MSILFPEASNNFILSLKLVLISTTVLSAAVALKLSAPAITEFAVTEVPSLYHGLVSWLKPPYLYLVINCIIITIVASSKLQSAAKLHHDVTPPLPTHPQLQPTPFQVVAYYQPQPQPVSLVVPHLQPHEFAHVDRLAEAAGTASVRAPPEVYERANDTISSISNINSNYYGNKQVLVGDNGKEEFVGVSEVAELGNGGYGDESNYADASKPSWSSTSSSPGISRTDSLELSLNSNEKPPVSARFGHRRTAKASPDQGGKAALGVLKPRRQETLESTWKTITEGRAMPLTRHLRKSDTWETHGGRHHHNQAPQNPRMIKSETFADHRKTDASTGGGSNNSLLSPSPGSGKLKREASPSQDELNRRVEAFIKKFNEEMRLQRQESLNQYMEMINRGAH
ncbi:unnamed protein product [Coffea canephora]|uniref:DUF4408 domain-containing protein n=2 Tax=Coffea TaxID=13442 RepID=A0A068UDZ6_COFCA|nr:unnamed protein product [Coffea canephora]